MEASMNMYELNFKYVIDKEHIIRIVNIVSTIIIHDKYLHFCMSSEASLYFFVLSPDIEYLFSGVRVC